MIVNKIGALKYSSVTEYDTLYSSSRSKAEYDFYDYYYYQDHMSLDIISHSTENLNNRSLSIRQDRRLSEWHDMWINTKHLRTLKGISRNSFRNNLKRYI